MPFVLQQSSVIAPVTVFKTCLRSNQLPCFSTIPHATRPFFKQWYIHTIDVIKIMTVNYAEARWVVSALRSFYGKSKREVITVEEFCAFTNISKSYVRMHLVSRVMEGELRKQVGNVGGRQWSMVNGQW